MTSEVQTATIEVTETEKRETEHHEEDSVAVASTSATEHGTTSEEVVATKESAVSAILSIENLVARKRYPAIEQDKSMSSKARAYYKKQDEFIDSLVECNKIGQSVFGEETPTTVSSSVNTLATITTGDAGPNNVSAQTSEHSAESSDLRASEARKVMLFAKVLLGINVFLVCAKLVAAILSGSLAIVSVLVDNVVDLLTGLVIWLTNRAMMKQRPYAYPQGRRRLEPLAIIILAVIMSVASAQVVIQGVERIADLASSENPQGPEMQWPTLLIIGVDIAVKVGVIVCFFRTRRNSSVAALIQDARNDIVSNSVSITCGLLAYYFWPFIDPIGAIIISSYIITGWVITLIKKMRILIGISADPVFIRRITWLCVKHDERIKGVDTVRAFHVGSELFVEVDIVLPDDMPLKEAHDIGETLQRKIETLPEVGRAFVHLDYDTNHHPNSEHKLA